MCEGCYKVHHKMLRCDKCQHSRFCSMKCVKAGWKRHKPVCKALREFLGEHGMAEHPPFLPFQYMLLSLQVRTVLSCGQSCGIRRKSTHTCFSSALSKYGATLAHSF